MSHIFLTIKGQISRQRRNYMRRIKKVFYVLFGGILLSIFMIAGCGSKSEESVMKNIDKTLSKVSGYKATAKMTMKTGEEERKYNIDIWYKKNDAHFYRVDLLNEAEDRKQIILKNEEGVFVLTPVLNKSFKFQSDWPENSGQPYLYQSLVNDLLTDSEAAFTAEENYYKFKTKTNYMNNKHLPVQEIYFDKKTYLPSFVKIMDENEQSLVEVTYEDIQINPSFAEADFDREFILSEYESGDSHETIASAMTFEVLVPLVTKGAQLTEREEVDLEEGKRVIMTFKGERNFTLIQESQSAEPAMTQPLEEREGEVVHLGHSVGVLSNQTIEWTDEGVHYHLASEDMTLDELIDVASSVYGREIK